MENGDARTMSGFLVNGSVPLLVLAIYAGWISSIDL